MGTIYKPVIDMVKTGKKLKSFRELNHLTVDQLRKKLFFEKPQVIYNWESGKNLPSVFNFIALASNYGVTINELLSWSIVEIEIDDSELKDRLTEINEKMLNNQEIKPKEKLNVYPEAGEPGNSYRKELLSEIGENLKRYRNQNQFTISQLQAILQIENHQGIYAWEAGEDKPSIDHALILSKLYGVAVEDLFPVTMILIPEFEEEKPLTKEFFQSLKRKI